jgi:DUF4097 and DUF4098 domain-containing protein YvlB
MESPMSTMFLTLPRIDRASRLFLAVLVAASAPAAAGCHVDFSHGAEARDQWKRTYTLGSPGSLEIRNTNGRIRVESADGNTVEVVADRTVKAGTDQAAKAALASVEIRETIAPNRVALDSTSRGAGFEFNVSRRVDYVVRVPRWAAVRLDETNGEVEVEGLTGALQVSTTNGRIIGRGLEGSAAVESTNGAVRLDVVRLAEGGVSCKTTNGAIEVTVPPDAKARISARVTNGRIMTDGLALSIAEQSRRRLDASIGGGGPEIRLETTNGLIQLRARQ